MDAGLPDLMPDLVLDARMAGERDRRTVTVRLTEAGQGAFATMAAGHEGSAAFAGVAGEDVALVMRLLGPVKESVRATRSHRRARSPPRSPGRPAGP